MYNTDNEKLIAWTKRILICAGFWNMPITDNKIFKSIFFVYSVMMRIGCFLLWFSLFAELMRLVVQRYDTPIIIVSLSVVVNASKIMVKLIIYSKHNILEQFKDIIEQEKKIWQSSNGEIRARYEQNIRNCRGFIIALGSSSVITAAMLEISGAYGIFQLIEYNNVNNASLESHFMYQTILPLNKLDHLYWTFVIQAFMSWVATTYNCTTHLIFTTLLIYAASQMQVLQFKLRNYVEPDFSMEASQQEINDKVAILKGLLRHHNYIIGYVSHINECTKYIIMLEFILSSLDLASVSANVIKMNKSDIGWLLIFFVLLIVQIFLISWTSNEIKIESEAIADAVYESRWYLLNKEAKQLTQVMIARAQKPLVITIGPFGPMTTDSLLLVLKAAYSYVSIMKE